MTLSAAEKRALVREYEASMEHELATLDKAVDGLDRTYASLDVAEDFYRSVLAGEKNAPKRGTADRLVRYTGETLIAQAGGRWACAEDRVVVTKLPATPAMKFFPQHPVDYVASWPNLGVLRDHTERHDVALQRRLLAELTRDVPQTLAQLRADVLALTGVDPGAIDDVASLAGYEDVLRVLRSPTAPREERRKIHRGLVVAIGALMQRELGAQAWVVEDAPRDIDFGKWTLFRVRLTNTMERFDPSDGSVLAAQVEKMIAAKRPRR